MSFSRDEFVDLVYDALNHLYDFPHLQRHPLIRNMMDGGTTMQKIQRLRRTLLDAIQAMSPKPGVPADAMDCRSYRILELRYLEGLEPREVMEQVALAKSQYYREQGRAIEAVAAILQDRWQPLDAAPSASDTGSQPDTAGSDAVGADVDLENTSREHLARREVERLTAQIEWENVNLSDLLVDLCAFIKPLALAQNTQVHLQLGGEPWVRDASRVLMRQAILNALTFALDVARGGDVFIQPVQEGADEGIRIRALPGHDARPAVPDRDSPVRLGIGLEVCCRLLKVIEGGLDVVDTTGGAWEARLHWPISRQGTLLVIDDNVGFINLFRRYLAGHAWNVVGATSSAEARQILADLRPAVILLDVMMPKEDGWELLCTLKTGDETKQIPVIICSVLNEPALAFSLGAAAYLPKPVSQQSLMQALSPWSPTPASPVREH